MNDDLELPELDRLERICDSFEADLRAGKSPKIETLLPQVDTAKRGRLFRELLKIELDYLEQIGQLGGVRSYEDRFPEELEIVREAYAEHTSSGSADTRASQDRHMINVRCPHCHGPVQLADDALLDDIVCPGCGSSFSLAVEMESTAAYYPGDTNACAHFRLLERIGIGAFGTVWKALDTTLERTVALKLPRKRHLSLGETEQFLREARAAAQLQHPHIVSVHEVGIEGDVLYIVCDLVEGLNLAEWMKTHRLTPREAADLCAKMASALQHAHESGVVHRDLKPSNVMIDRAGEPHITDFGLAKRDVGDVTVTVEGQILGTPAYMSPEQARGEATAFDGRTDIYSLGVVLFEMLTCERPFRGTERMLLHQVICDPVPRPRRLNQNIPRDLETICLKCLEKDMEKRYQSAGELREEFARYLSGEAIHARRVGVLGRLWRWYRHQPAAARMVAGVLLLFLFSTTMLYNFVGCLVIVSGIHPGLDPLRACLDFLALTVFIYLPGALAGLRIVQGKSHGLWAGIVICVIGVALVVGFIGGKIPLSYVQRFNPTDRFQILLPFILMCCLSTIASGFAIMSSDRQGLTRI